MSHPNPQAEYGQDEIGTPMKKLEHRHTYCGGTLGNGKGACTGLWNIPCCSQFHQGGGSCPEGGTEGQTTKLPLGYKLVVKNGYWQPEEVKPSQRIEETASYSTKEMYCSLCTKFISGEELPLHVSHFQIAAAEEQKEAAIIQKLYYQKLYSNPDEQHTKSGIIS